MVTDISDLLNKAFRPHAPVEGLDGFVGRTNELERIWDAITQPGLQIIIFGEKGAGKTSLANVSTENFQRVRIFCPEKSTFQSICYDIVTEIGQVFPSYLVYDATTDTITRTGQKYPAKNLDVNMFRQLLPNKKLCIVLDEVDRIKDKEVIWELAELTKSISTYCTDITCILVGVANNADELLHGHASNYRNLSQISLDQMTPDELKAIISHGEKILNIVFAEDVKMDMLDLCNNLPYYLILLARHSAKNALKNNRQSINRTDLIIGVEEAAKDADLELRGDYETAILSVKKSQIYRRILWSMALLSGVSHTINDITVKVNELAGHENGEIVSNAAVSQALNKLISEEKKAIVISKAQGFYSFRHPLMKGFVRLIKEKL